MRAAPALLAASLLGACAVPNLVLETGAGAASLGELRAPARAEWVELAAADGATLRGVWIPGEPGAPVVLQLMEATVGATESARVHGIFWDFPGAGYALLALDYRGVGASSGARSSAHLRADARAMWREAVARAGGDPARVVLRGGSLGALAAAALLQDGARPGAVVLYGPVRSETVARNFMTTGWAGTPRVPARLAPWLALLFRRPLAVDLVDEAARCRAPLLVSCGAHDELLPPAEAARLEAAVLAAGGDYALEPFGHVELCTRHHRLGERERAFLAARMPVEVDAAARERELLAAMGEAAVARLDAGARATLRALAARRIEDPPAAVAGLLLAGFPAERAAAWLDAERAARGRWLGGLGAAEVQRLAGVPAADGSEDAALLALAVRVHSHKSAGLSIAEFSLRGKAEELAVELKLAPPCGDSGAPRTLRLPADDLVRALAGSGSADPRARLELLLAVLAGPGAPGVPE